MLKHYHKYFFGITLFNKLEKKYIITRFTNHARKVYFKSNYYMSHKKKGLKQYLLIRYHNFNRN